MIRKKVFAVLASGAAAVAAIGVGGAAQADTAVMGHYNSSISKLQCTQYVLGDGNGGTLSAEYQAWETRADVEHFRGAYAKTRVLAQELTYNGTWKTVKRSAPLTGTPRVADVTNHVATSYFYWNGTSKPRLQIAVKGYDDIFRIQVRTRIYSDENARLAYLKDSLGNCHV